MKAFSPTYLYVKRHTITGLLYLGKTKKNPATYLGSGLYWSRHLKVHGKLVETLWCKLYTDKDECQHVALKLSTWFNVVNSKLWANLKHENGLDGGSEGFPNPRGMLGKVQTIEARIAQSKSKLGTLNPNFGKRYSPEERMMFGRKGNQHHMFMNKHTIDTKQKMCENHADFSGENNPMFNRKHSSESKERISEKMAVPKNKICRIFDQKEMSVNHFTRWLNSPYKGILHE
jgi:dsDNA-binding SOS-regulon protein